MKKRNTREGSGEVWKYISGYEGLYRVSTKGRVHSVTRTVNHDYRPRVIKARPLRTFKARYESAVLSKNGVPTTLLVHRLVAEAFIPNPESKPQVNHKNGIKTDNRVENLEWCDRIENMKHARVTNLCLRGSALVRAKITEEDARLIKHHLLEGTPMRQLSEMLSISVHIIRDIKRQKTWNHV